MFTRITESNLGAAALVVVAAVSLVLNVGLGWKVRRLEAHADLPTSVPVGMNLGTLHLTDHDGAQVDLMLRGKRQTILYVMSPTCRFCLQNEANVEALANEHRDVRVVGISTSAQNLKAFVALHRPPFPIYVAGNSIQAVGFRRTPQTLLVNSDGTVKRNWEGVWTPTNQREIDDLMKGELLGAGGVNHH